MNLVGKIFTVLIFLMCVVFGAMALMVHAAHKNWKEEIVKPGGLNEQLIVAKKEVQDLTDEKTKLENKLKDEQAAVQRRLTALEEAARQAKKEQDASEAKFQAEAAKNRELTLAIEATNKNVGVLQAQIDGMRGVIKVAVDERHLALKKLLDTTDSLNNAVNERDRLEKLGRQLGAQILVLRKYLAYVGFTPSDMETYPPPGLEGEVTAVPRPDTVEISVGADDGVRAGHRFVVTRNAGTKYVGVIQVTRVDYPNRAVCRPVQALMKDQIQKGDHVKAETKPR